MEDGCGKFARAFVFLSNFIIWIGSVVLLVFGIWTVVDRPYLEQLLGENVYITAAYILIAVGAVMFFVSFLACFGALKEIKCMLLLYFIIVLLLFIVLLVGGILGYVFKGQAQDLVNNKLTASLKEYEENSKKPLTMAWDNAQDVMNCCGVQSYEDWVKLNKGFSKTTHQVPKSCCKKDDDGVAEDCQKNPTEENSNQKGCYEETTKLVKQHAQIVGGVGIGVAILMLLGLIFSMILFKMID